MNILPNIALALLACVACTRTVEQPCRAAVIPESRSRSGANEANKTNKTFNANRQTVLTWIETTNLGDGRIASDAALANIEILGVECKDAEVLVRVALRNRSSQWLWLRTTTTVGYLPSLHFDVIDASGVQIEQSSKGGLAPQWTDYVMLGPGAEIAKPITLVRRIGVAAKGGTWTIVATYRDQRTEVLDPPEGTKWFSGQLKSAPIAVEVSESATAGKCELVSGKPID